MAKPYVTQGAVETPLTVSIETDYPHIFVGVSYYTDDTYTTIAEPTTGTAAVGIRCSGNSGYTVATNSPLDCSDPSDYAEAGVCADSVQVTLTGIDVATHYKVTVTASAT